MTRVRRRRPSRRTTRRGFVVSAVGALVVAAALVWQSSYAGFDDTTGPLTASVGTGSGAVAITNEIEGVAPVTLPALRPGDAFSECIIVTSTGSRPAQVRLYAKDRTSTANLVNHIQVSWTAGTGGGVNADCSGFVSNGVTVSSSMGSFPTGFAQGILAWDTAGGAAPETRTYRVTFSLSTSAPASVKGASARLALVWEAQNR